MWLKIFCFLLAICALVGCDSRGGYRHVVRIGIDPDWYPIQFGPQTSYVNGFIEDLLLQISKNSGIKFERIHANWDSLYDGLQKKQYDAVLGSLPSYDFYSAKYGFSENVLDVGPVLIVPVDSKASSLQEMEGKRVGLVNGDPAIIVLQKDPKVMIRDTYTSIPDLLMAVVDGEIQGAVLEKIPAANYLQDLFIEKLKAIMPALDTSGLHLIVLKGERDRLVKEWNQSIDRLKAKGTLEQLLKKWQLS